MSEGKTKDREALENAKLSLEGENQKRNDYE